MRRRTGGLAATSAKVLILIPDPPLPAVAPCAETPFRSIDDGNDDDTSPSVLVPSVGAWIVGRACAAGFLFFRLALPLPPPVTVVNPILSADGSTVDHEVSLAACNHACTVPVAAAASVAGGGGRSPGFISRHHSTNLRRNRILISSSGSGGPGTPNLNLSASLLFALLPSPSGQRERRDAGQGCEGGGGGGPIIAPVGVPGAFPFVLLVEVIPSLLPFAGVIRAIGSLLRAFLGQPFHRFPETADLSLQKAHLPPQVCAVLFLLTVGRSRTLHCRLFVYRSGLRPIASRNVAAVGTAAGSSGVGGHSSGLCVGIGVGVRPDSSAESESPRTRLPTACGVPCLRRDRWQRRGCL